MQNNILYDQLTGKSMWLLVTCSWPRVLGKRNQEKCKRIGMRIVRNLLSSTDPRNWSSTGTFVTGDVQIVTGISTFVL